MADDLLTVRLKTLMCYQIDEQKFDDIFIKYKGKKIWPVDKKHEDVAIGKYELGVDIAGLTSNEQIVLEIWDHDTLSPNDLLGTMALVPDKRGAGPYTVDMQRPRESDMARYSIAWEVL
jgi:hypothetical protein